MENVVIIGSGCAGWTAALYAARANLNPLLLTGSQPGGLLTTTSIVENYPGFPEGIDGTELMVRMQKQAERFGARTRYGEIVTKVDLEKPPFKLRLDEELIESKAVIIATGASHRRLGLKNEELLERKGVTYCATCDGALPMFRNKPLVVVGGGDSACEEAIYLTHFASKVYLVHRRDQLRASKIMADRALSNPKIQPVWDSVVTDIHDVGKDAVTGVQLKNVKTGAVSELPCARRVCRHWPRSQHRNCSTARLRWMETAIFFADREPTRACPACSLRETAWTESIAKPSPRRARAARRPSTRNVIWRKLHV